MSSKIREFLLLPQSLEREIAEFGEYPEDHKPTYELRRGTRDWSIEKLVENLSESFDQHIIRGRESGGFLPHSVIYEKQNALYDIIEHMNTFGSTENAMAVSRLFLMADLMEEMIAIPETFSRNWHDTKYVEEAIQHSCEVMSGLLYIVLDHYNSMDRKDENHTRARRHLMGVISELTAMLAINSESNPYRIALPSLYCEDRIQKIDIIVYERYDDGASGISPLQIKTFFDDGNQYDVPVVFVAPRNPRLDTSRSLVNYYVHGVNPDRETLDNTKKLREDILSAYTH